MAHALIVLSHVLQPFFNSKSYDRNSHLTSIGLFIDEINSA